MKYFRQSSIKIYIKQINKHECALQQKKEWLEWNSGNPQLKYQTKVIKATRFPSQHNVYETSMNWSYL